MSGLGQTQQVDVTISLNQFSTDRIFKHPSLSFHASTHLSADRHLSTKHENYHQVIVIIPTDIAAISCDRLVGLSADFSDVVDE